MSGIDEGREGFAHKNNEVLDIVVDEQCKYCGGDKCYLANGTGPHAAQLKCLKCYRHKKWISPDFLNELIINLRIKRGF